MSVFEDMKKWRDRYAKDEGDPRPGHDEGASDEAPPEVPDDGRRDVDLDDEAAVSELEDGMLKDHMHGARRRYLESQQKLARVPPVTLVREKAAEGVNKLSRVISATDDVLMPQATAADEVFIIGAHLSKWRAGASVQPFFPDAPSKAVREDEGLKAVIDKAHSILKKDADQLKKCREEHKALQAELARARVLLNESWESFQKICLAQKETIQMQRELLKASAPVIDAERIKAAQSRKMVEQPQ